MAMLVWNGLAREEGCLVGALFCGGRPASRPGLRLEPRAHLASWDRESGVGWVGVGAGGLAAGWMGAQGSSSPESGRGLDSLARALAGADPEGVVREIQEERGGKASGAGWLLVAGAAGVWLAEGRGAARELGPGAHLVTPDGGLQPGPWPGQEELAWAGLPWEERLDRIRRFLDRSVPGCLQAVSAALVGTRAAGGVPGLFLFRPGPPGAREWLDYSNLLTRLRESV